MSFVTTFLPDSASVVPSTLCFFLGTSSRSIADALALELKLESDHSEAEDKEQSENSKRKKKKVILHWI